MKIDVKYGIVAINPENDEIVHFCGYVTPPTPETFVELKKEIRNDPEFGLEDVVDDLIFREANNDELNMFKEVIQEFEDNDEVEQEDDIVL